MTRLVNGVFKGGGAKGVVYAGALHEVRARGIWFTSVAGASAGAITATLIAAGYGPDDILRLAPEALPTVRLNLLTWLGGRERSLYKTAALRDWVEGRLRDRLPNAASGAITFAQLNELGPGIELNVVAMDLARNEPIVFNWRLTPDFSIAEAVIASSAIPVAMPGRRVLVIRPGRTNQIHRLVDGGTWANYPAFIYRDPSLRSYFGLPALEFPNTLGFVIESIEHGRSRDGRPSTGERDTPPGWTWPPTPPIPEPGTNDEVLQASPIRTRFDQGSARRMGIVGSLLTWAGLRWLLLAAIVVGVWVLVTSWGRGVLAGDPLDLPSAYQRSGTILLLVTVIVVVSLGLTIVLVTIRFGAESVDAGLPSLLAATSASIGVARWVGTAASDPVIRLSAPLGISVVGFTADRQLQALAVIVAAEQAGAQLDARFDERRAAGTLTLPEITGVDDPESTYLERFRKLAGKGQPSSTSGPMFLALFWGILLISFFWIFPSVTAIVMSLLVGIPFAWWVLFLLVRGRMYNQAMSADAPVPPHPLRRLIPGVILFAAGYVVLGNPQSVNEGEAIATGGLILGQFWEFAAGVFLIAGAACILSGLSRISARVAARRYRREVDVATSVQPAVDFRPEN
ncbi:patatin-like phospholipase family protein [Microbacterium sp. 179-I 3D2 NHS]|uniref:patatin-like phospholipase family protein n=1 Tax=Microbacterium sp. 179-I 3D2 NHS TaxID=3235178 RepID=UPI0039A347D0